MRFAFVRVFVATALFLALFVPPATALFLALFVPPATAQIKRLVALYLPPSEDIDQPAPTAANLRYIRKYISGDYRYFNGFSGRALALWADGNCNYQYFQDVLGSYREISGTWSVRDDGAIAIVTHDKRLQKFLAAEPTVFFPVRWGPRLYLIGEREFLKFAAAIADHSEPHGRYRQPPFLLRIGDEKLQALGLPNFPTRFRALLDSVLPKAITKIEDTSKR